nr:metallophosphoesterase [Clostridiales bacterium]
MIKLISTILAAVMSITSVFISARAPKDTSDFTPVLRFIASSDSHIGGQPQQPGRVQKMIKTGYAVADADEEYDKLDAVLIVGDLTNRGRKSQFLTFYASVKSVLRDGTQFLPVMAKSHDGGTMSNHDVHEFLGSLTGEKPDLHKVINGFHFIGLSASDLDEHYSEYQREWLIKQLDEAVADDPDKPIFVFQHEHISDTVYGSYIRWGMDYFRDILVQYPQVVDISGHSHYPLNDPRSIWQDEFTAIGTGALYYSEFTIDDVETYHPSDRFQTSTFWIIEADASNR